MKYTLLHRLSNVPWPKCMDPKSSVITFNSLDELNTELDHIVKITAYTKYQFAVVSLPSPDDEVYVILDTSTGLYWPSKNEYPSPCKFYSSERPQQIINILKEKNIKYKDVPLIVVKKLRKEID